MKKNYILSFLLTFLISFAFQAQTITQTYSAGDIPTSYGSFDATCSGPLTTLTLQLPAGGPWEVTGFDVEYDMTAASGAYMSEQRSLIHLQNNGAQESDASGVGSTGGTYSYNRTNISFANDYYAGGTNLIFEMRSWRTWGGTDCGTNYNKVDDNTWTITVHYQLAPSCIAPIDIEFSNITVNSVDVSWTEIGSAAQWNLEYGLQGFAQGTGTTIVAMSQMQPITGLTDLTEYDVYLQSDCGGGDESTWIGPITFKTAADCSLYTLEVTATTDGSVVCKGVTTLTATGSGDPNAEIYWFDAATGGNIVGTGNTLQTPVLTTTTSFWAAEVIVDGGSGGSGIQTYCTPTYTSGCGSGDNINDFIMTDAGINHIGSGCSPAAYGDFTGDPALTGNLLPGETYNFQATHNFGGQFVKIWIDLDGNGSFEDAGELLFTSSAGSNNTSGSITIPSSAQAGVSVMRVMCRWLGAPTNSCTPGGGFGETHDYKVLIGEILCESTREEVIATVTQDGDEIVTEPLPFVHSENTATYGNTFTGSPGNGCGTIDNYLNGSDVVYQYSPTNNITVNIDLSDLSGNYAGVFVYENCGDIEDDCIAGAVNGASANDFGIADLELIGGEDYYIVISSWLAPSVGYTLTISESLCPQPSNLQVSNIVIDGANFSWDASSNEQNGYEWAVMNPGQHPDTNTPVQTNQTATATTSVSVTGLSSNTSYSFYVRTDCATDGLSGWIGPVNFQTPITGATCEAAIEITSLPYITTDNTSNYGDNYDGSPGSSGCGSTLPYLNGDDVVYHLAPATDMTVTIQLYNLTDTYAGIFVYESCDDIGVSCIAGAANQFSMNDLEIGELPLEAGQDYYIVISTWAFPQSVGYTLEINMIPCPDVTNLSVSYDNVLEEVEFTWGALAQETGGYEWAVLPKGDHPDSATPVDSGATATGVTSVNIATSTPGDYDYFVRGNCGATNGFSGWVSTRFGNVCESAILVNTLPYVDTSNTAEYGDNYDGVPGSGCGSTFSYLGGDDVVYHFVPDEDMAVNIELSGLSANYAGIFVYESCADIGVNCFDGAVNGFSTATLTIEELAVLEGQDYYIVISTWPSPQSVGYTLTIEETCFVFPDTPTGDNEQSFCEGATIEDIVVTGTNIKWYTTDTGTNELQMTTTLQDGETYYAVQVDDFCESTSRLAVTVTITERSEKPVGYVNQTYVEGNTIADLEVTGVNLTWYIEDGDGMLIEVPESTVLIDQVTYYVSQTTGNLCESNLLGVTVHEVLTIEEVLFGELSYFPNPVDNVLNVVNPIPMDTIEVYNLLGQKVITQNPGMDTTALDLSGLASGTYVLIVTIEDKMGIFQVIKK